MNCIALAQGPVVKISTAAQRRATDPEIAILQLSEQEYQALHENPKDFVNSHHVFEQQVREMIMQSPAPGATSGAVPRGSASNNGATWLVLVRHRPDSSAVGAAVVA